MPVFTHRSYEKELMDDFEGSGTTMDQTLRELEVINHRLGGNYVTINGLKKIIKQQGRPNQPVKIADLGCGGGDMLMLMAKWGRKHNIPLRLTGIDANPNIVEYARNNTSAFPEINYQSVNIFSEAFQTLEFDIMQCSLFTHHFTDEELVRLFSIMKSKSRLGFIINDIHRHWLAYYSIKLLTSWFSRSVMVRNDAPVSVLRAFTRQELESLLQQAGVSRFSIRWMWAFRWQVIAST